jgi:hypothetical protein
MHHDAYLNDFATRCFRDTADQDYIMARSAYRAELDAQFLWSGLQAIEKYIKAILLYNRIPQPQKQRKLGHDLERGLKELEKLPFKMNVSEPTHEIIDHLDTYGRFRYLDTPFHVQGSDLLKLDQAVWEIRLYCRVLDHQLKGGGETIEMLPHNLAAIERVMKARGPTREAESGLMGEILSKKDHPARLMLVWKNLFFNRHNRRTIQWRTRMRSVNSPLSLRPELLHEVRKYVWLPGEVVRAYEADIEERRKG